MGMKNMVLTDAVFQVARLEMVERSRLIEHRGGAKDRTSTLSAVSLSGVKLQQKSSGTETCKSSLTI